MVARSERKRGNVGKVFVSQKCFKSLAHALEESIKFHHPDQFVCLSHDVTCSHALLLQSNQVNRTPSPRVH